MRQNRVVWLVASLGALSACSGQYEIGSGNEAGSENAHDGSGGAVAGSPGGGSAAEGAVAGSPGGGGRMGTGSGATAGVAQVSPPDLGQAGSATGSPGLCGRSADTLPEAPVFAPVSPDVAWERISRFVLNEVTPPREPLPARTTLAWARRTALALLDAAEADAAPPAGLVQFVGNYMLGSLDADSPLWPFPAAWAAELVPRNAVLGNLLAASAGLGEHGMFTDKAFNITYQTPSGRGARLAERLFCQAIPLPPEGDREGIAVELEPGQSRREALETATGAAVCTVCHRYIDPLGFSLENYDAAGEYRTIDNSRRVDASGSYTARSGQVFSFTSMADLAPQLAESCDVAECFARTLFDDALARAEASVAPSTYTDVELLQVAVPFMSSGFSIRVLIGEIVTTPSFLGE